MEDQKVVREMVDDKLDREVDEMVRELVATVDDCQPIEAQEILDDAAVSLGEVIEELEVDLRSAAGRGKVSESDFYANVKMLSHLNLPVTVVLGRAKVLLEDVFNLKKGSTVELDSSSKEPLEVMVNGRLFARGEGLIVNEKLAIRITEIVSPIEEISRD